MKIQLETITSQDKSFSMMFNPRLSDLFYWHFHPEYELVYIEAASGTRHIGEHISTYEKNDLVLIGSNIPHLNFDYGIKTTYRKVVVHLKKDFIENHISGVPELNPITQLFEKSKYGLAFCGKVKRQIGEKLFHFEHLNDFQRYIQMLEILDMLANIPNPELLHEQPYNNKVSEREQGRLRAIYAFVDKNYHKKINLDEVAAISNMSKEAFCRYFKKVSKYTFIEFLNRYRISQSKRILISGKSVSDACYQSGFESLSYFNRTFKKITTENPRDFRERYM
ncbi:AraC family transcriptional regulator [Flavobacteriaceae bacterium]|jgi:AraC-like DNA-binding protein|nr:AraC family transcriptional regulator [Algibacter sp.]MDA9354264.1 AraC family transcriptional regulator [Flavobacteriaceae bacterium]MDB4121346.1 AraC family transcriptional regulator [bacterium]MDA9069456.1 AraC family transcriptional regulator [Algibacter sp.]MDB4191997.1 AraC family transcriptional regulator [Flavobacteriaceae bacterium]MDB4226186.1 AraC family transcriptional regulator [Flavobacteriaceae bacterium]